MSYKVISSQKIPQARFNRRSMPSKNERPCSNTKTEPHIANKHRSCSTGTINNTTSIVKPKKTTKSESIVIKDQPRVNPKLGCQACGDSARNSTQKKSNMFISMNGVKSTGVQQYFKNKNFRQSSASIHGAESIKKVSSLNTINECEENSYERAVSEVSSSDSHDSDGKAVSDDIKELEKFRRENYFECHSAVDKLKGGASVTRHRCMFRFYLNERLFPVPVAADYSQVVRCTECSLPMQWKHGDTSGTIQAKVKINGQLQDMMLMLPARKSLIVGERRREEVKREEEPLYFGIVKLSRDGDSVFGRNLPGDSLALRYQKGYQELRTDEKYRYQRVEDDEVIVV